MLSVTLKDASIPALGFGTWRLTGQACVDSVRLALDTGYRHLDTAQAYGNEAQVGTALQESGLARNDVFLTTKISIDNVSSENFDASVERSLIDLKTGYVDLLLLHWPMSPPSFDVQLDALKHIQAQGLAKHIGVSNFTVAQMSECEKSGLRLLCNQVEYHPFLAQNAVLNHVRQNDMMLTAYAPLARGQVALSDVLRDIAQRHGKNPGQVALRWLLQQPNVAAIPKAGSADHIRANFDIFAFTLDPAEMKRIDALAKPDGRLIDPDWAPQWDVA